ncbi:class I SAM-dependent methyltransferase [Fructilactobacillus vespulae]|uniref:tRNA (mnm(5)s(2)U34)-methyltransferase n=1 Tax=Fructilactobacillus vespulae TaxID=1249630 RepID=UPI0039B3ECC1
MKLQSALNFSHTLLKQTINPGDTVIDATAGKGNDTLFLANLVGNHGHVYSFDIQKQATDMTSALINKNGCTNQTTVITDGHENVDQYVADEINGAIFNLGYLPTGNHEIITQPQTTISAVQKILNRLAKNGIIILVVYYGHPGGTTEKDQLTKFVENLDQHQFQVLKYQFINQINEPPILIAIQKR